MLGTTPSMPDTTPSILGTAAIVRIWHMVTHRMEMPAPHFKLPPKESQAVLCALKRTSQHQEPLAKQSDQRASSLSLAPAAVTTTSRGRDSPCVGSHRSSSSSGSPSNIIGSSSNSSSRATSQSEFVPAADSCDMGATLVDTRSCHKTTLGGSH